jgi:hypothetical protein
MKKIIIAVATALLLAGCGSAKADDPTYPTETTWTPTYGGVPPTWDAPPYGHNPCCAGRENCYPGQHGDCP